jgi:hypothetical protein
MDSGWLPKGWSRERCKWHGGRKSSNKKGSLSCLFSAFWSCLLHAVLLAELLDPSGGINNLLLAGIEGVALRAHFNVQILGHRGVRLEGITAAAVHGDFVVVGVNFRFHDLNPCLLPKFRASIVRAFRALIAAKNGVIIHDGVALGKRFVDK